MNKIRRLLAHFHAWFREYLLAALMAFPVIWLENPQLQALLPPEWVSKIAPFVAALLLIQRLRERLKAPKP